MAKSKTPRDEEAIAKKREKALAKARKKRAENQRQKIATMTWDVIEPMIVKKGCRCGLRKGMTHEELVELQGGCTDPHDYRHIILKKPLPKFRSKKARKAYNVQALNENPGYVCPVLDYYRRLVDRPQMLYDKTSKESNGN